MHRPCFLVSKFLIRESDGKYRFAIDSLTEEPLMKKRNQYQTMVVGDLFMPKGMDNGTKHPAISASPFAFISGEKT